MLDDDPMSTYGLASYKAFRNNNRKWFLTSAALKVTITAEVSDSVLDTMWTSYSTIIGELLKGGVFTEYTDLAGAGRDVVDGYLFLYAIDELMTGYRSITEAEWLVDVYDMLLKKWIKILTEDKLSLMNTKDPVDYEDDDFNEDDTEGFPGPTIACLWDEMTSIGYDAQTRREYVFDQLPDEATGTWTDDLAEDYMLTFYLDTLHKRFAQTFTVVADEVTFSAEEKTEWSELLMEVKDYPDWADAAHIAEYELGEQHVYLRTQRMVKNTQTVSADECSMVTDFTVYEDYRNELREWLLWSFCANMNSYMDNYKGVSVDYVSNFDYSVTEERCHTLNFMIDYLGSTDAPHTDDHADGDNSNNVE